MRKTWFWLLAASMTLSGAGLGALPAHAAGKTTVTAPKATPAATKPKELGGPMPLPVDQRISRANKPSDLLAVEVTKSVADGKHYVAYVKVLWGDLDNVIKGLGPQYYSDWDGSLTVTGGTALIDQRIQFDSAPKAPAGRGPGPGSGRDEVEASTGTKVEWKAGVVGAQDGLRIKITSPTPTIHVALVAGKFSIPITIVPAVQTTPVAAAQASPKSGGK